MMSAVKMQTYTLRVCQENTGNATALKTLAVSHRWQLLAGTMELALALSGKCQVSHQSPQGRQRQACI